MRFLCAYFSIGEYKMWRIIPLLTLFGLGISSSFANEMIVEHRAPQIRHVLPHAVLDTNAFVQAIDVLPASEIATAKTIVAGDERKTLFTQGDRIWVDGEHLGRFALAKAGEQWQDADGTKWQVVRYVGVAVSEPKHTPPQIASLKNKLLPVEKKFLQPLRIEQAFAEIETGDLLLPYPEHKRSVMLSATLSEHLAARLIRVEQGMSAAGMGQTIWLNRGAADGVQVGQEMLAYPQEQHLWTSRLTGDRAVVQKRVPSADAVGRVKVYRVGQHSAAAMIVHSTRELNVGDVLMITE